MSSRRWQFDFAVEPWPERGVRRPGGIEDRTREAGRFRCERQDERRGPGGSAEPELDQTNSLEAGGRGSDVQSVLRHPARGRAHRRFCSDIGQHGVGLESDRVGRKPGYRGHRCQLERGAQLPHRAPPAVHVARVARLAKAAAHAVGPLAVAADAPPALLMTGADDLTVLLLVLDLFGSRRD